VKNFHLIALATIALAGTPALAAGPNLTFRGDTSGAPIFHRPQENGSNAPLMLDDFGNGVAYQAIKFTVLTSGEYAIIMSSGFDNMLGLYSGSFNPGSPLLNAIVYNDTYSGNDSGFATQLNTDTSYFAVATGYGTLDQGSYTLSFYGPGEVVIASTGAVPEPATWAMLIAGFGLVGATLRQRRTAIA